MHFPVPLPEHILQIAALRGVRPEDVGEHFTRGGGHGGQGINKSKNCVELTHHPTGITVRHQHHRHLHQNREEAWALLIMHIEEHAKAQEQAAAAEAHRQLAQRRGRTKGGKEKMLREKKQRAHQKKLRQSLDDIPNLQPET